MRLALAQMKMDTSIDRNLAKTIRYMERAAEAGADMIFFPEVQLTPFFPQYEKRNAELWAMDLDGPEIAAIRDACRMLKLCASPNVYLKQGEFRYDASLMLDAGGGIIGFPKWCISRRQSIFMSRIITRLPMMGSKSMTRPLEKSAS